MLLDRFHRLNIGKKLIFIITVCSLTTLLAMCLIVFLLNRQYAVHSIREAGDRQIGEGQLIANNACSYLRGVADIYCADPSIQRFAQSKRPGGADEDAQLRALLQSQRYVLDAVVYDIDGEPICSMAIDASHSPASQAGREPFETLKNGQKSYFWEYIEEGADALFAVDNSPKLCLWHTIRVSRNSPILGVMAVSMDVRRLLRFDLPFNSSTYWNYFFLEERSGRALANYTDFEFSPEDIGAIFDSLSGGESPANVRLRIGGTALYAFSERILDTPLFICSLIPEDSVTQFGRSMRLTALLAVLAILTPVVPMLIYVYRHLTQPLQMLISSMDSFAGGNFDARLSFRSGDDIERVGDAFNRMVTENRELIQKTYVSELRAREAELALMQAQIKPHFIYNLINSIQWTALRHGEQEIADTAHSMGQMLRLSLNQGENVISVRRECELVGYYLQLQKSRYRERLEYEIQVADEAWEARIPKLIIQPLVENSVVHNIENHTASLNVRVDVSAGEGRLRIRVSDDGAGIPPDKLRVLFEGRQPHSATGSGYAIRNIRERLELTYGENFRFHIESGEGEGTRVYIELPLRTEDDAERREDACSD